MAKQVNAAVAAAEALAAEGPAETNGKATKKPNGKERKAAKKAAAEAAAKAAEAVAVKEMAKATKKANDKEQKAKEKAAKKPKADNRDEYGYRKGTLRSRLNLALIEAQENGQRLKMKELIAKVGCPDVQYNHVNRLHRNGWLDKNADGYLLTVRHPELTEKQKAEAGGETS
jgi:hypothetical protein